MSDFALFRLPCGKAWLGLGPFSSGSVKPDGPAFYVNDFDLSDPKPWKQPATCIELTDGCQLMREIGAKELATPQILWSKPQTEWFKMVFRRIRREVQAGRLRKMVPVLCEPGQVVEGHPLALLPRLLDAGFHGWGYAWGNAQAGFLGLTPELLLEARGHHLETMALAGTAKPGGRESFCSDAKEIEEHELVVLALREQLQQLGRVTRQPRAVIEAGSLVHFHSSISVELAQSPDAGALVELLHPTPAVGCLPRNEQWLQRLRRFRQQLNVPGFFGAPFGFTLGGGDEPVRVVVAIRGLGWRGTEVSLPSGCGIVSGSAFDHEWRELRLKREAVARQLGLMEDSTVRLDKDGQMVATTAVSAA